MRFLQYAILAFTIVSASAEAKTRVVVLSSDFSGDTEQLLQRLADAVISSPTDRLLVYTASPPSQIAAIAPANDPTMNNARRKAQVAAQFSPIKAYFAALTPNAGAPPDNLMIPAVLDEIGRNVIPSLPEKRADVLLIGSLIYFDKRDRRWSMTERFYPSDGLLHTSRIEVPFGIAGEQARLAGATLHFCSPDSQNEYVTPEHEERVRRFWSLWTTGQSGRIGTFTSDLATCFQRFLAGEASGQAVYHAVRGAKAEMLRVPAPMPASLPASTDRPGEYFLRDDVPISRTPPTAGTGVAWIGLKWSVPCDIDLYARPDASSKWLYYGQVRTGDGYFSKDFRSGTGDSQFEYIEFTRSIDLAKTEVAVNLYAGDLPAGPEGIIRVWFRGQVYEAPFKLTAKSGNRGARPMSGSQWLRIDLRSVVGLKAGE